MGIGVSIFLIAAGAILTWGVTTEAEGLNVGAIGVILMVVGLLGFLLSMIFWSSFGGYGVTRRRTVVADGDDYVVRERRPRRTTVVEERDDVTGPPPA
jgi:uncharacterized protein DUF6458